MKIEKLFLVGTHRYSFNSGLPAEVIGVDMVHPSNSAPARPCFRVRFENGDEDWVPIFNVDVDGTKKNPLIELISEEDFSAGRIPEVTH